MKELVEYSKQALSHLTSVQLKLECSPQNEVSMSSSEGFGVDLHPGVVFSQLRAIVESSWGSFWQPLVLL